MKKTNQDRQIDRVLYQLNTKGYVDNFWAFHNYILRLGAIIYKIKKLKLVGNIDTFYGDKINKLSKKYKKNTYYVVKSGYKILENGKIEIK